MPIPTEFTEEMEGIVKHYRKIIDERLQRIDKDLHNVEKDVEKDLENLIAKKLATIRETEIRESILRYKDANRDLLVTSRRESLERARQRLLDLRDRINSVSDLFGEPDKELTPV